MLPCEPLDWLLLDGRDGMPELDELDAVGMLGMEGLDEDEELDGMLGMDEFDDEDDGDGIEGLLGDEGDELLLGMLGMLEELEDELVVSQPAKARPSALTVMMARENLFILDILLPVESWTPRATAASLHEAMPQLAIVRLMPEEVNCRA